MKNKGVDKGISAAAAITFVGLIQSPEASHIALAALTVALYEVCLWACRIARREARRNRRRHYITATRFDMERVADQVFNPIKEVGN